MAISESISKFLLPDATLSLKVLFDNVRNYLICAGLVALALWFYRGAPGVPTIAAGSAFPRVTGWLSLASAIVAGVLFLLNSCQFLLIFQKIFEAPLHLFSPLVDRLEKHPNKWVGAVGSLTVLVALIVYLVSSIVLFTGVFLVVIYLLVFSAFGSASR